MNNEKLDLRYYAKVHSIESFGTVDGPGIRFVLFLQGCSLKCKYCHNRDTWDISGGKYKSLDDIFNKIMNYKNYITPKGGVTVTGGEPLLQVHFLIELFTKLKEQGIHTCIDTSGMVALTDDIKKLLNLTDLVLLDIKHIDPEKCKELVGFSNKLELETKIIELETKVKTLEEENKQLKTDKAGLETKITEYETETEDLNNEVDILNAKVELLEKQLDTLIKN